MQVCGMIDQSVEDGASLQSQPLGRRASYGVHIQLKIADSRTEYQLHILAKPPSHRSHKAALNVSLDAFSVYLFSGTSCPGVGAWPRRLNMWTPRRDP